MLGERVLVPGNDVTSRRSLGILNVFVAPGQGDTREYFVSGSSLSQAVVGTTMSYNNE